MEINTPYAKLIPHATTNGPRRCLTSLSKRERCCYRYKEWNRWRLCWGTSRLITTSFLFVPPHHALFRSAASTSSLLAQLLWREASCLVHCRLHQIPVFLATSALIGSEALQSLIIVNDLERSLLLSFSRIGKELELSWVSPWLLWWRLFPVDLLVQRFLLCVAFDIYRSYWTLRPPESGFFSFPGSPSRRPWFHLSFEKCCLGKVPLSKERSSRTIVTLSDADADTSISSRGLYCRPDVWVSSSCCIFELIFLFVIKRRHTMAACPLSTIEIDSDVRGI